MQHEQHKHDLRLSSPSSPIIISLEVQRLPSSRKTLPNNLGRLRRPAVRNSILTTSKLEFSVSDEGDSHAYSHNNGDGHGHSHHGSSEGKIVEH